jgi:hypothetical protein
MLGCAALCIPLAAAAGDWNLRMDGIGPLKVGMRYDEANRLVHGTLRRVDVMREGVPTERGIVVGDPVKRVFELYPRVASEPDAYDDRERYLTVRSRNGELALRFETSEGKVASFHAGRWKEVQYVEGCL